jgi:Zn-dependent membrane protease YugP
MDDMIQQGRDPEWRLAFEEHLDDAARAQLRRAVRNGQSVDNPDQAAIAVGLARREQRRIQFLRLVLLPVQLLIAAIWVSLFVVGRLPAAFGWFWVAVLLVLMAVVPFTLRRRHQVAGRAVEVNERIARNPG